MTETPGATAAARGPIGETRSIGLSILWFILTIGIYGFYWVYKTHEEIKRLRRRRPARPGRHALQAVSATSSRVAARFAHSTQSAGPPQLPSA